MRLALLGRAVAHAAALVLVAVQADAAGFERVRVPLSGGGTAEGGVWYPSDVQPAPVPHGPFTLRAALDAPIRGDGLPVILVSHGTVGWFGGHHDTAEALADAGFVVAALTHPGDNVRDESGLAGQRRLASRPADMADLLEFVGRQWQGAARVDLERVGAFGYSAGGYTVLTAAGARPDFSMLRPHCGAQGADKPFCDLLMAQIDAIETLEPPPVQLPFRALSLAAPAPVSVFDRASLASVGSGVPLQVWSAEADELLGGGSHADALAEHWPGPVERRTISRAGHFVFLTPCPEALTAAFPEVCLDPDGVDRPSVHRTFNENLIRFFQSALHRGG